MNALTFNVIRLNRGPNAGQVWILPNCRQGGYRMRNGRLHAGPTLRAQALLCTVSYEAAFWYARGLLQGETGQLMSPYMKPGRAKHWKALDRSDEGREPYRGGRSDREDFHADG